MKIRVDGDIFSIHNDHDAFKKAIEIYCEKVLENSDTSPYSPTATLVSKTYVNYRDGENPYYLYEFECND